MLALEDLVDLGEALRLAGFRVATQQYLAAQQLLLRLAADGALPATRHALESYLGPIFCTSALEQRGFEGLYRNWLRQRFPEEIEPPPEPGLEPPPAPYRKWKIFVFAMFGVVALCAVWFSWQNWRTRVVVGTVTADGKPAVGATLSLAGRTTQTGYDGAFSMSFTAAELPASLNASLGSRETSLSVATELVASRPRLYCGAPFSAKLDPVTLDLPPPAQEPPIPKPPPTPTPAESLPQLVATFNARDALPQPSVWDRVAPRNLAIASTPLLLFLVWQLWRRARRPSLQRMPSRTPPQLNDVHLPGGVRAVLPSFPVRRLAQELRRRRLVESSELQVEPTIAATLHKGGFFTAVRGSRVEPDYFALVDRTSLSDHQALLASEIVAELARGDVLIERYDFDRDATICRPRDTHARARLHPTPAPGRPAQPFAVELSQLRERYPEHRVLMFSDGVGCFDGFTGEAAPWLTTLLQWPLPVLITPLPPTRWGRREWALQQLGLNVLPLSRQGCVALMSIVGGAPAEATAAPSGSVASGLHERTLRRWLERDPPPPETVERLCRDLRADLGPRGFAWIAACAAYPEIHWGITLRLGPGLVPDPGELEQLLPRVARLVWFREAYMPDWLREALLERIEQHDDKRAREILLTILAAVVAGSGDEVPLRIATGQPTLPLPRWQRAWNAVWARRLRGSARDMLRKAPPDSPLHDYVFLRFLSGQSRRRLDLTAPGALSRLLRTLPAAIPGKAAILALALTALAVSLLPPLRLGELRYVSGEVRFAGDSQSGAFSASTLLIGAKPGETRRVAQALARIRANAAGWAMQPAIVGGDWIRVSPDARRMLIARAGALAVGNVDESIPTIALEASAQAAAGLEHDAPSNQTAAFSDDGNRVAVIYRDGSTAVWDTQRGKLLQRFDRPAEGSGVGVALSRDGRRAATSVGGAVVLWDPVTGRALRTFAPSSRLVTPAQQARFSSDGRLLASWGSGSVVDLWDTDSGELLRRLEGHKAPVRDVTFSVSTDGGQLATIDDEGSVRLWDASSGQLLGAPLAMGPAGSESGRVAFSPDGRILAGSAGERVSLWSVPPRGTATRAGRSFALVVGNNYPGMYVRLASAVFDARSIAAVLRDRYGFGVTLLEDQPREALIAAADSLAATTQPDDRVVVFLAGLGTEEPQGHFAFLTTPKGRRNIDMKQDAVYGDEIGRRLVRARSREVLVLGDASRALLLAEQSVTSAPAEKGAARILISSYSTGEPMETSAGSPFALALVDALRAADTGLTARSLFDDITQRMAASKEALAQRPSFSRMAGLGDGGGEFRFPNPIESKLAAKAANLEPQLAKIRRVDMIWCQGVTGGRIQLNQAEQVARALSSQLGAVAVDYRPLTLRQNARGPKARDYEIRYDPSSADDYAVANTVAKRVPVPDGSDRRWNLVPENAGSKHIISIYICPSPAKDSSSRTDTPSESDSSSSVRLLGPSASYTKLGDTKTAAVEPAAALQAIRSSAAPNRSVSLKPAVNRMKIGEDVLDFEVTSAQKGYLSVLQAGSDGKSFGLLFPNDIDKNNYVNAGSRLRLPRASWRMKAAGPPGTSYLLAIVSEKPRDFKKSLEKIAGTPFYNTPANRKSLKNLLVEATGQNADEPGHFGASEVVGIEEYASAEPERIALVLGNAAYTAEERLNSPRHDAADMSAVLKQLGFSIVSGIDLDQKAMKQAVIKFAQAARDAEVALFYYAGHGVGRSGDNWLIPVETEIADPADLRYRAVSLRWIADRLKASGARARILIVDSCRNNRWYGAERGPGERGLTRIAPPTGTLIAYAAALGETINATHPTRRNSLYTGELVEALAREPELEIRELIRRVGEQVHRIDPRQSPSTEAIGFYASLRLAQPQALHEVK